MFSIKVSDNTCLCSFPSPFIEYLYLISVYVQRRLIFDRLETYYSLK